jgi:hypothetical protein
MCLARNRLAPEQRLTDPPSTSDNTPETDPPHSRAVETSTTPSKYRRSFQDNARSSTSDVSHGELDMNDLEALQNLRYPTPLDYYDEEDTMPFAIKMEEE